MSSYSEAQEPQTKASQKTVVIMLGPPGSGKGTQAAKLTKEIGIPHISTGDLFRENIAQGTDLGHQAKSYMDAGKLTPDQLVLDMLFDRVSRKDCENGFLLDGFPRTLPQAQAFDQQIEGTAKLLVFNLAASDNLIEKRIEGRETCKSCASIFNTYFSPPKIKGICDNCGGELFHRPDDRSEIVQERLRVYNAQTKPLIGYYDAKGILITIDGESPAETVYEKLVKIYRLNKA